jgi:thiol:disulfide interchange protein DsbC
MLKQLNMLVLSLAAFAAHASDAVIRQALVPYLGDTREVQITDTPLPGIKAVKAGLQIVYVSENGRYVLGGPLVDMRENANLTELALNHSRAEIINARIGAMRLFHFPAPDPRHEILVFTDVDCGFCRQLHANIDQYHQAGLSLRYVMLPRAGVGSASYRKTVDAVCSDDPEQGITEAMNGQTPAPRQCDHPIDDHIGLARALQINATPTMLLEDGRLLPGMQQPDHLVDLLSK